MPPAKKRRSPLDRFTDATPTAISAGFSAAMNIGPQPKAFSPSASSPPGIRDGVSAALDDSGSNWLQGLQHVSGFAGGSSGDLAASDDEHDGSDGEAPAPKPAKGKNAPKRKKTADDDAGKGGEHVDEEEATLHRKAQNRIAQREFRQRKQQYIRALEARVELLSSDHDTQVDRLRHALRGLLSENNTLRAMLGSLGRFIGEGLLGGPLQQMGVSRDELLEMINGRSEKTMTDAWQNWPGAKECEALRQIRQDANIPAEGLPDMRNSPGPSSRRGKRKTTTNDACTGPGSKSNAGSTGAKGGRDQDVGTDSQQGTPQPQQETSSTARIQPNQANTSAQGQQQPMQPMPQQQNNPQLYANGGQDSSNPQNYASLLQPANMMNPSTFGVLSQNGQEDALIASLFGTDSFASPASHAFFRTPGDFDSIAPVLNGTGAMMPAGQGQQGTQQVTDSPAANTPTAANTPLSTALYNSAQQFLSSLRHLSTRDDVQRITSISQQLNQLRAAQGRSDFIPILHHDPEACKNAANINLDSADGGSVQSEEEMGRMTDACIQMAYHMSNYRRNASYRLPALLRPTDLQLTRPHDPLIDAIPWPALRDALILCADRINMDEVMFHLVCATKVGEGDVFNQLTWLLDHSFVLRYPSLATPDALDATNRWRKTMNMDPLTPGDIQALSGDGLGGRSGDQQSGGLNELRSSMGIGVSAADRNKQQQQQQQRIPSGQQGGTNMGNATGPSTPSRAGVDGQGGQGANELGMANGNGNGTGNA